MATPISPEQAKREHVSLIPDEVIEIVNGLIRQRVNPNTERQSFDITVDEIKAAYNGNYSNRKFDSNWLNFEPIFRKAGWEVVCDVPAYYESYSTTYRFSIK